MRVKIKGVRRRERKYRRHRVEATAEQISTIDEAAAQLDNKEIDFEEFKTIVRSQGGEVGFWNTETEPHPAAVDNEKSRVGMKWNPFYHERGKWFQYIIKDAIKHTIAFAHKNITKRYDENAFVYEDKRLLEIERVCRECASDNFQHEYPRKSNLLTEAMDILLFTMKEDIYYRGRILDFLNRLPNEFEITEEERKNIEEWH